MTYSKTGSCHARRGARQPDAVFARLPAYADGEVGPLQGARIEAHLAACAPCREELAALRSLSDLLQAAPAAAPRLSEARFVAQVGLKLPRRPERTPVQEALLTGWRLMPVLVVGVWLFIRTAMLITTGITALLALGIGGETLGAIVPAPAGAGFGWPGDLAAPAVTIVATITSLLEPGASLLIGQVLGILTALAGLVSLANSMLPLLVGLCLWSWLATWMAAKRHVRG
jgi:anti-sigma factor RsiW